MPSVWPLPILPTRRPNPAITSSTDQNTASLQRPRGPWRQLAGARAQGYQVTSLGDAVTGEARVVAVAHAKLALEARARGRRLAIISGGELEVTVHNRGGRGGRSQEYALALAIAIKDTPGIAAIAADTDGIDGGEGRVTDPAGAVVTSETVARAAARHLVAQKFLDENNATPFFEALGDLVVRGPTHTNVNDFRAILVDG